MRSLSIHKKMSGVFAVLSIIMVGIAAYGLHGFKSSNDALGDVYQNRLLPISDLASINHLLHDSIEQLTIAVIARPSPQNVQKYIDRVEANISKINDITNILLSRYSEDKAMSQFKEWIVKRDDLVKSAFSAAIVSLKAQQFNDAEDIILGIGTKKFAIAQQDLNAIIAVERQNAETAHTVAEDRYNSTRFMEILVVLFGVAICGLMALYVWRSITGPLLQLTVSMRQLAKGYLDTPIPSCDRHDEIGRIARALGVFRETAQEAKRLASLATQEQYAKAEKQNELERHIKNFKNEVVQAIAQLATASFEMRSTAQSLSTTAEETSQQSNAATATSENASNRVAAVASAADQLSASIGGVELQAQGSQKMAQQAVEQAGNTAETARELEIAISKINDFMGLIKTIAGQTNLLALNATIEAARAGEAGRGFAVVASEVKNLADQTTKATEEVGVQIESIQTATKSVVDAIQKIGITIHQMNKMTEDVSHITGQQSIAVQEIAHNAQQASGSTQEALNNISGVSKTAANNGVLATHVLGTAGAVETESEKLRSQIDDFLSKIQAA